MMIRRATPVDAAVLAKHRAAVWHEVGEWSIDDLAPQISIWTDFLRECIVDATYIAFVVEDDGRVVGSGGVLIHVTMPRPGFVSTRAGRVQSLYVEADARRRGIARAVMAHILQFARAVPLVSLTLHPSDEARMLYANLGFEMADEMLLRL